MTLRENELGMYNVQKESQQGVIRLHMNTKNLASKCKACMRAGVVYQYPCHFWMLYHRPEKDVSLKSNSKRIVPTQASSQA